jgi:hypothetical protein
MLILGAGMIVLLSWFKCCLTRLALPRFVERQHMTATLDIGVWGLKSGTGFELLRPLEHL